MNNVYYIEYNENKNNTFVCYYTGEYTTPDEIIKDTKNIKSSIEITKHTNRYEITNINFNSKYTNIIIQSIQRKLIDIPIGITVGVSKINEIKYLVERDFINPRVISGTKKQIYLEFVPNSMLPDYSYTFNIIEKLINQKSPEYYYIDLKNLSVIYNNYVQNATNEWGGVLKTSKKSDNYLHVSEIIEGDSSNVMLPQGIINFHTHPRAIYNLYKAYIGWPSHIDMGLSYYNYYKKNKIHLVFGVEGIYSIQIHPDMSNTNYSEDIQKTIVNDFGKVLEYRNLDFVENVTVTPSNKNKAILEERNLINIDNKISIPRANILNKQSLILINEFIKYSNNYMIDNKKAFICTFKKWSDIIDKYDISVVIN